MGRFGGAQPATNLPAPWHSAPQDGKPRTWRWVGVRRGPGGQGATYDAVVVGAGVIGSATALALSRRGWRVLVVDRHGAAGHGSTSASAGIVRVHATSTDAVILAEEGLAHWESWRDFLDAPEDEALASFRRCGTVVLDDGTGYTVDVAAALTAVGSSFERWGHDTLAANLPEFDLSRFGPPRLPEDDGFWDEPVGVLDGAIHTPASGFVADPALAAQNLLAAALRSGAVFRPGAEVVGVTGDETRATGLLFADSTSVSAPVVLNAAGPESARLNRLAGAD